MTATTERKILLLGSGYVAKPCADIILRRAGTRLFPNDSNPDPENHLTVASRRLEHAQKLASHYPAGRVTACTVDVNDAQALESLIAQHDLTGTPFFTPACDSKCR
jgi:saccharopine dehydrogenase-like NADP-dependent oxidoreductase